MNPEYTAKALLDGISACSITEQVDYLKSVRQIIGNDPEQLTFFIQDVESRIDTCNQYIEVYRTFNTKLRVIVENGKYCTDDRSVLNSVDDRIVNISHCIREYQKVLSISRKLLKQPADNGLLKQEDYALLCALNNEGITTYIKNPTKHQLQHFGKYKENAFRREIVPGSTKTKIQNKINRYERVKSHLTSEGRKRWADDMLKIQENIEKAKTEN